MYLKRLGFRRQSKFCNIILSRSSHQLIQANDVECEYPAIIDMSKEGQRRHQRQLWYDSIKALPTVEQKLYELELQQRKRLRKYLVSSVPQTYLGIPFRNYITRTHIIDGLPGKLMDMNVDDELSEIRDVFNEVLLKHYNNLWEQDDSKNIQGYLNEKNAGSVLVNNLILQCYKKLALRNDYILESTIQRKPRLDSFWWHGGFESKKDKIYEKNLCFQFQDYPSFVIRMKKPLSPIVDFDDPLCCTAEVPDFNYHPKIFSFPFDRKRHITSIPGYWPGDPCEFPLLLVYTSDRLQNLLSKLENYDLKKIEDSVGVMASFGWLNGVAAYQGFTPYHDITYPFVTQGILTNGQDWNFFIYQLNTIAFHSDVDQKNRRNICWCSEKMRLFDTVEDGQVKGINEEIFHVLLKFLLNAPVLHDNLVLKPYLGIDDRSEEDAKYMRFFFRRMCSQAPDPYVHREEIPTWQRIYKRHPKAPPSPFIRLA